MVLFDFNSIVKDKYQKLIIKNQNNSNDPNDLNNPEINFEKFNTIALEQISKIFPFYFSGINVEYIKNILLNEKTRIVLSCIDEKFSIKNITSILIYHKTKSNDFNKYYVLILGTHERFRKYGYGKVILDEFVNWIKSNDKSNNKKKILLKSLDTSLKFYLDYGFECVQDELAINKLFFKYEPRKELKNNQEKILEFYI